MALTKKMLIAMEISSEKVDEIMTAHVESINALRDERDKIQKDYDDLKAQSKNVESIQKELDSANAELEKFKSGDWEKKYNDLKSEYDGFKKDTEAKATKSAKESAYKKLLTEAGVSAKRIDSILKVSASAIDDIKFDKDGNVEGADKIVEGVKKEWADFISTTRQQGANVSNPPANDGDGNTGTQSRATEMVSKYYSEHYGNPNKED